jgi:hypothetical protein
MKRIHHKKIMYYIFFLIQGLNDVINNLSSLMKILV